MVGEADTAAAGARAARALKPEVVLVDVGLPDSDGIALAHELSALPWRPRVVLTSVDPDAASPDDVERSGAHGFVPKHDLPGRGLELLQDARVAATLRAEEYGCRRAGTASRCDR